MRRPTNPLSLAVLVLLYEKPMHPYEMSSTLRFRHKDESIKINYGSLYAVVESLERKGLVEATERLRAGRRPERTVYALTADGEAAMKEWLAELVGRPSAQFTDFEAALSLLPALPPEAVGELLDQRLQALIEDEQSYQHMRLATRGFPRLFSIENEYQAALRSAEIAFVRELLKEITDGSFEGLAGWRRFHELKKEDPGADLMPTLMAEFFPDPPQQTT